MRKTFCDICGKEITSYRSSILLYNPDDEYDKTRYDDVCIDCENSIKEVIKSRRKEGTK